MSNSHYKKFNLQGYDDEAIINVDGKMTVLIKRTNVGYVIDAYNASDGELLNSITVWDEELEE